MKKSNNILLYIVIIFILFSCTCLLKKYNKEYYDKVENDNRPPGPWGKIGTGKPWYDYPYILHNVEYY
jgi:hypothetical protein